MKKLISVLLAALLLIPAYSVASALPAEPTSTIDGVTFYDYVSTGAYSEKENSYNVLHFNTNDGYVPMAYTGTAGKTASIADHVAAAKAEGYKVYGAINAAFFDMSNGDPCDDLIYNEELVYAQARDGVECILTTFDYKGNPTLVSSKLSYAMTINGESVEKPIGMINKDYTAYKLANDSVKGRFHYFDSYAKGDFTDEEQIGYEILCKKSNGTRLSVGETLQGTVVSVTADSFYGKTNVTEKDEFILFVKADSAYADYVTDLAEGDSVEITVTETISNSKLAMNNAYSAIGSTYWLARNGSNIAASQSAVIHPTTQIDTWTAFGWDSEGNYYFMASEFYQASGATLRDIAQELLDLGCENAVRLDGGGSTAMWVEGKDMVYNQYRKVTDVVLVVEKPETPRIDLGETLKAAEALFAGDYSAEANAYIQTAYKSAYLAYNNNLAGNQAWKQSNTDLANAIAYIKDETNFPNQEKLSDFIYVNLLDASVATGSCSLFTSEFNGGELTQINAGYGYSYGVLAEKVSDNKYKVLAKYEKYKDNITLEENQILIMTSYQKTKPVSEVNRDRMLALEIGQEITLCGIDIENGILCACGYISAEFAKPDPEPDPEPKPEPKPDPDPEYVVGDVNGNGKIDARDYLLLKRAYFGTYTLTCADAVSDINGNGKIDARDYLLLKRAYFGTYEIK